MYVCLNTVPDDIIECVGTGNKSICRFRLQKQANDNCNGNFFLLK